MDFNVNVNVKFDATPALVGAVSALAGVLNPVKVLQPATITAPIAQVQEAVTSESSEHKAEEVSTAIAAQQPEPQREPGEITDEMLRKIVGPKSKDKGKDAVFAILDGFGVKRVPDLKQEQRQAFIDKLNAL